MKTRDKSTETDYAKERQEMVRTQIETRGVKDPLILKAMRTVPRHLFMPEEMRDMAYADRPLPIGQGQTISQPYIVAYMSELLRLRGGEKVLEIGTGLGYQAAVLSCVASFVYTVEYHQELIDKAERIFQSLEYTNILTKRGDGSLGWEEHAPYDGIIATASGPEVPRPLKEQLKTGGRLVMPIGHYRFGQQIVRVTRGSSDNYHLERFLEVSFVPLVGEYGWDSKSGDDF
ncbi:MAG: protein-L-isoaspartate(D-aspartate) O-methyltransferase [Thermodesulfobacteriota bacterium]